MRGKLLSRFLLFGAFIFAGVTPVCSGTNPEGDVREPENAFSLFSDQTVLKAVLKTDLWTLTRNPKESAFQDALLSLKVEDNTTIDYNIRLRPRGISRRNICNMPPLLLRFGKDKNPDKAYRLKGDVKLVSYCQNKAGFDDYVLKEYLAYRLYNAITDYSLRVRLLELTYVDQNDIIKPLTKYSFLIEDIDDMAKRVGCREQKIESIPLYRLDIKFTTEMDLFQYMIGNTDWSCLKLHNVKIIAPRDTSTYSGRIPVPYDFDYAGLVNATYAVPNPDLGINSVTERVFRGMCRTPEEYNDAFMKFSGKKDEIMAIIEEMEALSKTSRNICRRYIEQFYQIIENPRSANNEIIKNCRK